MEAQTKIIEKLKEAKKLLVSYMYKHYPELLAKFEELPQYEELEREIASLDKQIAEGKEIPADLPDISEALELASKKSGKSTTTRNRKEIPAGAEEIYQKVYVNNENDLPKEDGIYLIAKKNNLKTSGLKPKIYTVISKKWWLENVEWYLIKVKEAMQSNNLKNE